MCNYMPYYSLLNNPILPPDISDQIRVYVLYALNADLTPQLISRVLGNDPRGILYIGRTTEQSFRDRVHMFRRVSNPNYSATAHSGALNFKQIVALRDKFPVESLYVQVLPNAFPKTEEQRMLEAYRQQFGEVPPLNSCK
jgi:hypothetical protein